MDTQHYYVKITEFSIYIFYTITNLGEHCVQEDGMRHWQLKNCTDGCQFFQAFILRVAGKLGRKTNTDAFTNYEFA